jgi:hypothetical protein
MKSRLLCSLGLRRPVSRTNTRLKAFEAQNKPALPSLAAR